MNIKIYKSHPKGEVIAPPSKSYSHRYLIAAMLANGRCKVKNIFYSNDIKATLNCMSAFGCTYTCNLNDVEVTPSCKNQSIPVFECNESGSTLRFLIPIALSRYNEVVFKGTETLISRGIGIYESLFNQRGIEVIKEKETITIKGNLSSGKFIVDGSISSQFISGLLFTLPILDGDSELEIIPPINSINYINMTLKVLNEFGIIIEKDGNIFKIKGNQMYKANDYVIEGDYSNSAFLEAFNYFDGNVSVLGLNKNSLQGDKIYQEYFKKLDEGNPTLDISNCIDLGPILMTFAALKNGATFTGTKRLEIKESKRAHAIKEELLKVGCVIDIYEDEVIVHKCKLYCPSSSFDSHNDHRIVMALSLLSTLFDVKINDVEAINKSYPTYFEELVKLGVKIDYETFKR